jgi:putative alpha-1,2-mannosidase
MCSASPATISSQSWDKPRPVERAAAASDWHRLSIRDIYRAENSLLTLMAPERIDGMVRALLRDYAEGFMPKWPNPAPRLTTLRPPPGSRSQNS